ncbi:hypothetical protein [Oceanibacterium hippocampi]|uniref:Uncharacterized protein n=1 Tax=Oceanibacterium hippocampi TaxID=745714 RepID=A0A1Y5RB22_9PROT|nr:hypothetical protein [Oceanibacterium hippocampi]SLN13170.1 hypothetical protein OCH7691_00206 [Oceanibacterium hippocampi]
MTICIAAGTRKAQRLHQGRPGDWLTLAASPTFLMMAWFSASEASGMPLCAPTSGFPPIGGMTWMYLLMSLFHLSPWLNLVSGHLRTIDRTQSPIARKEGD